MIILRSTICNYFNFAANESTTETEKPNGRKRGIRLSNLLTIQPINVIRLGLFSKELVDKKK